MIKTLIFVGILFSGAALAQQVDISGKDFQSGAGDAKLAEIAQQAVAQDKGVTVTAPAYWQAKIAEKLHAGAANVRIRQNGGFFENVLVRVDDAKSPAKAEPAKAKPATTESTQADATRAAAAKVSAARAAQEQEQADREAAANAEAARAQAAKEQAARDEAARIEAQKAQAAREEAARVAAVEAAAKKVADEKAATEKAEADKIAAVRKGMEHNLNEDRPADGTMTPTQLKPGDQLFVDGTVRAVVRRVGVHTQLYWLEGDLNLERIELQPTAENRYKIIRPISDTDNPVLRVRSGGHIVATVPAAGSATRTSLQQDYADGRDIIETLQPSGLRAGDFIYTGDGAAVVVRRSRSSLLRFWLVGDLDLAQTGMISKGGNVYRVLSDTVK